MEYIKSVETQNFHITCEPSDKPNPANPQNSSNNIKVLFYGNSEDGLKFCASQQALDLVKSVKSGTLPNMIRAYETMLPAAKFMGFLDTPDVQARLAARTSTVVPGTPAPEYRPNPLDSLGAPLLPVRPNSAPTGQK